MLHECSRASRADLVQQQLLESIQGGCYQPVAHIRETAVAGEFGVSRTPVREALRRLESDGLLHARTSPPRKGCAYA